MGKEGGAGGIRKGLLPGRRRRQLLCLLPLQCPLYLCPPLEALEEGGPPLTLGLEGEHQRSNATLALQLARCWLQRKDRQGEWQGHEEPASEGWWAGTRGACLGGF